jgi:hypothetical protein
VTGEAKPSPVILRAEGPKDPFEVSMRLRYGSLRAGPDDGVGTIDLPA